MCHLTLLYSWSLCTTFAHTPQRGGLSTKHFHKGTQRQRDARRTDDRLCTLFEKLKSFKVRHCVTSRRSVWVKKLARPWVRCISLLVRIMSEPLTMCVKARGWKQQGPLLENTGQACWHVDSASMQREVIVTVKAAKASNHPKSKGRKQKYVFT